MNSHPLQQSQEDEYDFPYHHIARFKEDFSECVYDTWGINYVATIEFILAVLDKKKFSSLIDIGCGDGRLVKEISSRFPDRRVVGVDYSAKALSFAKAIYPRGEFYFVNILDNGIDTKFDIATLIEVLEHIEPAFLNKFIKRSSDVLTQNGTLLLTVPHGNIPVGYKHFQHFSLQSLIDCLDPYFKVVDCVFLEKMSLKKYLVDAILVNRFFILNHRRIKNFIYRFYKSRLFISDSEKNCGRIFIKATLKN